MSIRKSQDEVRAAHAKMLRARVMTLVLAGRSCTDISRLLKVNTSAVYKIVSEETFRDEMDGYIAAMKRSAMDMITSSVEKAASVMVKNLTLKRGTNPAAERRLSAKEILDRAGLQAVTKVANTTPDGSENDNAIAALADAINGVAANLATDKDPSDTD